MARLIHTEIKQPLANELLFGRLQNGGRVMVDAVDGALSFSYEVPGGEGAAPAPVGPVLPASSAAAPASGDGPQLLDGDRHDDEQLNGVKDPVRDDTGE